jgi:hypothetical protein
MLGREIKELKTGARELRKFGLLVGGVFALLGLLMWVRHKPQVPWFLGPGVVLMAAGAAVPRALKPIYIAWMALALTLGLVVSTVILTLFFFLVITPIGWAARLLGKDFLRLKLEPQAPTYWLPREGPAAKSPADYEKQY